MHHLACLRNGIGAAPFFGEAFPFRHFIYPLWGLLDIYPNLHLPLGGAPPDARFLLFCVQLNHPLADVAALHRAKLHVVQQEKPAIGTSRGAVGLAVGGVVPLQRFDVPDATGEIVTFREAIFFAAGYSEGGKEDDKQGSGHGPKE